MSLKEGKDDLEVLALEVDEFDGNLEKGDSVHRTITKISFKDELKVPLRQRRGLLARLSIVPEYKDARDFPKYIKMYLVGLISFAAGVGPMCTTVTYPAMEDITADLNTTRLVVNITVGLFVLALGIVPLWWSQFSERFGRRTIYIISFTLSFAFQLGSAFVQDIATFAVLRTLVGASGAAVLAVGAGTISDLYPPEQRGQALSYYYLGPLIGPLIGPIIGSLLLLRWNWRASQWFLTIISGVLDIFVIFTLPETLRDIRPIVQYGDLSKFQIIWKESYSIFIKPLKSLYLLTYLPVLLIIQQMSIMFGILYLVTLSIQYEFARPPYSWRTLYVGFAYAPQSIFFMITSIVGGRWTDKLLERYKAKHGVYVPECRLSYNILLGSIALPVSSLIFGWCFHYKTQWVTPLIGTSLFGVAYMALTSPCLTYLVDSLPGRGATGVALNNFVRSIIAAVLIFCFDPLIRNLHSGPMMTLFSGISIISSLGLWFLKKKGAYLKEGIDLEKLYTKLD